MSEKKIKVTDKRLFTSDGELRDEYRDLANQKAPESAPTPPIQEPEAPSAQDSAPTENEAQIPDPGQEYPAPTFLDLVGVVAQPIALYLGDAKMPDGESLENLELARLYIDLLDILRQKSEAGLTPEEKGFLDDLLYQLRLRYVEKTS